jgi:exosortase/archaeosortase family protein
MHQPSFLLHLTSHLSPLTSHHSPLTTFIKDPRYKSVRGVLLFLLITYLIHISFRFWAIHLHYFPIEGLFASASLFMENLVFKQTHYVMAHLLQLSIIIRDHSFWFPNKKGIIISEGCTGLKQFIQVSLLFLIYPGPWKHKAWFIPAGIILMHITNILRITLLGIAIDFNLPATHFIHSYILRPLFYVVIFGMWWIWEEKIRPRHNLSDSVTL